MSEVGTSGLENLFVQTYLVVYLYREQDIYSCKNKEFLKKKFINSNFRYESEFSVDTTQKNLRCCG